MAAAVAMPSNGTNQNSELLLYLILMKLIIIPPYVSTKHCELKSAFLFFWDHKYLVCTRPIN